MTAIIKRLLALATAFTLALSLVGCGVDVTGVSLNLPDTIEKGTTLVATPEYAFDGATPETAELEKKLDKLEMHYTSSDPSILVVDDNGNLVAVSTGTAEVALSSKDGTLSTSKTLEVIVSPTEIKTADELTLTAGETATLETVVAPTDATHVSISYASSDDSIATVNDGGEVKAVAAGDATVTAVVDGTSLTSSCKVTVLPALESIELSNASLSLQPNDTAQLSYTAQPENQSQYDKRFLSRVVSNPVKVMPTIQMNFMQLKNRAQKSNRMGTYNAINNQIMDLIDMLDGNYPGRLTQVQRGEFFIGYNQQMHYNRDAAIAKKREKEENTIAMSAVNTVATVDETTVA